MIFHHRGTEDTEKDRERKPVLLPSLCPRCLCGESSGRLVVVVPFGVTFAGITPSARL